MYTSNYEGIRSYNQPRRNAYKIINGRYGGLLINVPRLMNNYVIEARNGGNIIYEKKVDRSLIDLITKRYNPKKGYTPLAIRVFNDLNVLSGIPPHKSSGKSNLIGGATHYTNPKDVLNRLTSITEMLMVGDGSLTLVNEAWDIINELLEDDLITKKQHTKYIKKYLTKWYI